MIRASSPEDGEDADACDADGARRAAPPATRDADVNRQSPKRRAWQEEKFVGALEAICARAEEDEECFGNMNDYCAKIFSLAAECHVRLQAYFISTAIAIKVLEGMASSLDSEVDIASAALPYIARARLRLRGVSAGG